MTFQRRPRNTSSAYRAALLTLTALSILPATAGRAFAQAAPARPAAKAAPAKAAPAKAAPAKAAPARLLPLHISGTAVLDSRGRRVWLRGVNAASLEWTSTGDGHILDTVRAAVRDWHANIVRLPLSQDRWFGKAPEQTDGGTAYRALVADVVRQVAADGAYIMLDLHWNDAGVWGQQIGQHVMPDDNSLLFWKDLAPVYRNNPAVLFDLYNEPHDVPWDIWLHGGTVTDRDRQRGFTSTYQTPGMQGLLDAVRATGAKNMVVAGGLDWAYDMSGFLAGDKLADPKGNGVLYANHNYTNKGDTFPQWLAKMEAASKQVPIIVSEFGPAGGRPQAGGNEQWNRQVLQAMRDHKWNWTAWDMHPQAGPTLISDWNYTPTPAFGEYVREDLAGTLPALAPAAALPVPALAK